MRPMDNILTPADVCAILKACGDSQVRVLKFANLYVQFETKAQNATEPFTAGPDTEISETNKIIERESLAQDEQAVRQDQLDQMWIENPLEAERILLAGELQDGEPEEE